MYVYGWSQLFKDESENHKRVKDSVYDSDGKSMLFGEGHSGWSFTYLCHRCYDKVAYPSRYDTSWLKLSLGVGHYVYRRKRDKREVKRDSGTYM